MSYMRTTLPTDSKLTFYWRVSSETNRDFLEFRVNGKIVDKISGESGWQEKYFVLKGESMVEWRYTKNGSNSVNKDAGWVDSITVQEATIGSNSPILQLLLNGDS